ncbi:MAG: methyltransferase regulatory domain-containing protein [Rubrivivax sp.]|nr:methyltransferase regulatory domain-containing protein [Rubrivivax sp.]
MSDWNEGYITDVDYTYGFYKEMAPAAIRFALLAAGYESPPVDRFNYCELGYGQGAGLALLAAANPGGDFWGTDFNPAHAAGAARLAGEAGLKNLHVFDDSFEQFGQRDLPQFDYITLHGIWSWVGTEVAQQIVDFIRLHLKVGGVVYISYNTLPGWTHALPMRGLLSQYVEFQSSQADPIGNRLDGALKLLEDLNQIPGSYFHRTPQLAERIKSLQGQNRNYLAHEYLNRHWQPVFFSQMVEALTPAKLTFTAHAGALNCIDAVNHTKELQAVLDRISNPIFKEIVRDLGINQTFRRDLFVRGPRRLSRTDHAAGLLDTTYALVTERSKCELKIKTHVGEANLQAEAYDPVLDRLASQGPTQGRALMTPAELERMGGASRLLQALVVLVGTGYAQPCRPIAKDDGSTAASTAFNHVIIERTLRGDASDFNYLASAQLGSGIVVPRLPKFFIRALARQPKADTPTVAAAVWDVLKAAGQGLVKDGKNIDGDAASLQELAERYEEWSAGQKPIAQHLGLIA